MKRMISVLLCFALLLSCAAISFAGETEAADEPLVKVSITGFPGSGVEGEVQLIVFFNVSIFGVSDFEKCEMEIELNDSSYICENNVAQAFPNCKVSAQLLQPAQWHLTMQADTVADEYYPSFIFASTETADFQATIKEVKLYTGNGEEKNFSLEVQDNINVPVLKAESDKIYMDMYENVEDPERYICTQLFLEKCPSFESFEILITFNPEVLAYTPEYPFMPDGEMNSISCTLVEEGKLQVIGTPSAEGVLRAFEPICLQVIGDGETNIEMTLVSLKDEEGEVENSRFYFDFENFYALTCETYSQLTSPPTAVLETNGANVWWVPENMTVAQFLATAPTDMVDIFNADEEKLAPDEIIATGCEYKINHPGQFFNIFHLIVKYDFDGDGLVTSADARQALRFAVGLEKASKDQLYAANVSKSHEFTADLARTILRYSVGLEP